MKSAIFLSSFELDSKPVQKKGTGPFFLSWSQNSHGYFNKKNQKHKKNQKKTKKGTVVYAQ